MLANPQELTAWQMLVALLPVITGGLIGIAGGLSGTVLASMLQARHERAAIKRKRLEDIVLACHGTKAWTDKMDNHHLFGGPEVLEPIPATVACGYAAMYFPTLKPQADVFEMAALVYVAALVDQRKEILEKKLPGPTDGHVQAMKPHYTALSQARQVLQSGAEKLMHTL
jgi:hypothetical protein